MKNDIKSLKSLDSRKSKNKRLGQKTLSKREQLRATFAQSDIVASLIGNLPSALKECLAKGESAQEIYKRFEPSLAARAVAIGLTELDSSKAMAAIKDVRDRISGRPTEKHEVTHRYGDVSDEQLDAMVFSAAEELLSGRKEGERPQREAVALEPGGEDPAPGSD